MGQDLLNRLQEAEKTPLEPASKEEIAKRREPQTKAAKERKAWRDEIIKEIKAKSGVQDIRDVTEDDEDAEYEGDYQPITIEMLCYQIERSYEDRDKNKLPGIGNWYITTFSEARAKAVVDALNSNTIEGYTLSPKARYSYKRDWIRAGNTDSGSYALLKALYEKDAKAFL